MNTPGALLLEGICILRSLCIEFSLLRPTLLLASPLPRLCSDITLSMRATPPTRPPHHPSFSALLVLFSMTCVTSNTPCDFFFLCIAFPKTYGPRGQGSWTVQLTDVYQGNKYLLIYLLREGKKCYNCAHRWNQGERETGINEWLLWAMNTQILSATLPTRCYNPH